MSTKQKHTNRTVHPVEIKPKAEPASVTPQFSGYGLVIANILDLAGASDPDHD